MSTAERLEELRELPRVSAEDRERYEIWNRQARMMLAEVDPPHAARERIAHISVVAADGAARRARGYRARGYVPRHVSMRQWFRDWRSLPDYDGPPMRAPSGVVLTWVDPVSRRPVRPGYPGPRRLDVPIYGTDAQCEANERLYLGSRRPACSLRDWLEYLRLDYVPGWIERPMPSVTDEHFLRPSEGGRGWCPKLAGVDR